MFLLYILPLESHLNFTFFCWFIFNYLIIFALILVAIDFFGQRESMASMLSMIYLLKMLFAMVLFMFGSLTMDKISLFLNGKRQAKLDQELEDEE